MIDAKATQTLHNLCAAFSEAPSVTFQPSPESSITIGLEIECSWRSYFPDLWVDGFPDIRKEQLAEISLECSKREDILIPKLLKTVECGLPQGRDRYWEFAFDPVTDVSIVCNQIAVLQANGLIPPGDHSLHITVGGVRVTRDTYYLAFLLEMLLCSSARVESAFNRKNATLSGGWARKGHGGVFEKDSNELQGGCSVATEFRMLELPISLEALYKSLILCQEYAGYLQQVQGGVMSAVFVDLASQAKRILAKYDLPDTNWKKPNTNPQIWSRFAAAFPAIKKEFSAIANITV